MHVTARVHDPTRRTVKKTNDFAFSFDLYDDAMREMAVPPVRPMTYAVRRDEPFRSGVFAAN